MKVLDIVSAQQVSGGLDISVDVTVNTPDITAFVNMLDAYLLSEVVDAASFIAQINNAPASFSDMVVTKVTIGSFSITPN